MSSKCNIFIPFYGKSFPVMDWMIWWYGLGAVKAFPHERLTPSQDTRTRSQDWSLEILPHSRRTGGIGLGVRGAFGKMRRGYIIYICYIWSYMYMLYIYRHIWIWINIYTIVCSCKCIYLYMNIFLFTYFRCLYSFIYQHLPVCVLFEPLGVFPFWAPKRHHAFSTTL